MLAVLKAGGVYVPIDISYPDQRIYYILEDTKVKIILTDTKCKRKLEQILENKDSAQGAELLNAEDIVKASQVVLSQNSFKLSSGNLAYVIYTSGTTGNPKGVMIEHKGVVNLALEHAKAFGLMNSKNKHCLWYANYVFDAHVSELFSALIYGHIVHIISNEVRQDISLLDEYIRINNISVGTISPVLLDNDKILQLETIIIAGDKAPQEIFDHYYQNNVKVINAYGPTEVTVCASLNYYNKNGATNIGKPIANTTAYVLSPELQPLPIGVIGELYVGGIGVARGYLNNPMLTTESFITNPFLCRENKQICQSERLYKTGDLVRWLLDGSLEYIGRNDSQVKIRGFRVELEEIEKVLATYIGVKRCVVIAKENGVDNNKSLISYYLAEFPLDTNDILSYLRKILPEYMIPTQLIYLDKIPVTANGKLDKSALPEVELVDNANYIAPRNEIEKSLCKIYAELLELPLYSVGIKDDFFRLGGDSIVSIQLIGRIRESLGLTVSIQNIFDHKNIQNLYDNVIKQKSPSSIKIKTANCMAATDLNKNILAQYRDKSLNSGKVDGVYLANSLQQGFIYHYLKQGQIDNAYRMQLIWEYQTYININLLQKAWELAQKKYASLRLKFAWNEVFVQIIDKSASLSWSFIDLSLEPELSHQDKINELKHQDLQKQYILENGPLFRLYIIKQRGDLYTCIFSNHHAILDGWSIPILLNYVHDTYLQLLANKDINETIDHSYANSQNYIQENSRNTEKYWKQYLPGVVSDDKLSTLISKSSITSINNYRHIKGPKAQVLIIQGHLHKTLKHVSKIESVTINAILQYAWHKVLNIYCNTDQTIVGAVVSGRALPINDIEQSVGLYINTLPLVVNHDLPITIKAALQSLQGNINKINTNSSINLSDLQLEGRGLFNSLFVYENHPIRAHLFSQQENSWQNTLQVTIKDSIGNVDYPLSVMANEDNNSFVFKVTYASELFADNTIERLLSTFEVILKQISLENLNNQANKLQYLTQEQYTELQKINYLSKNYPNKTIHSLFEEQVLSSSDSTAIICKDQVISYQELNNPQL